MVKVNLDKIKVQYITGDVVMGELLADLPADGLSIEQAFELYIESMQWANGDRFFIEREDEIKEELLPPDTFKNPSDEKCVNMNVLDTELKQDIAALYNDYVDQNKMEPRFATVSIQYPQEEKFEVVFKMSSDYIEDEDDQIYYYFDSLDDLLGCCACPASSGLGGGFAVMNVVEFFDEL